jgi:hypothetical protein
MSIVDSRAFSRGHIENFGDAASISGNASPEHLHSTKKSSQQARAPHDKKMKMKLHLIRDAGRFN